MAVYRQPIRSRPMEIRRRVTTARQCQRHITSKRIARQSITLLFFFFSFWILRSNGNHMYTHQKWSADTELREYWSTRIVNSTDIDMAAGFNGEHDGPIDNGAFFVGRPLRVNGHVGDCATVFRKRRKYNHSETFDCYIIVYPIDKTA